MEIVSRTGGGIVAALVGAGIFAAACGGGTPTPPPPAAPVAEAPAPAAAEAPEPLEPGDTYACSMHPEVTAGAPGRCPKCGMDLTAVPAGETSAVKPETGAAQTPAGAASRPAEGGHGHEGHTM